MRFSRKGPKRLQYIITPGHWIHFNAALTVHNFHSPGSISLPGIAACDNGAGKFKHNNLSHPTGSPFIHLGREQQMWINCLAEGQKCRGDCETRTRTLSARVEWILQYTTTPPHNNYNSLRRYPFHLNECAFCLGTIKGGKTQQITA